MASSRTVFIAAVMVAACAGRQESPDLTTAATVADSAGAGACRGQVVDGQCFIPFTRRPELRNRRSISTLMSNLYPETLRIAGVGGTATLWLFIDREGKMQRATVRSSSGISTLDHVALQIAAAMRFSPATYRGKPVAVYVEMPIVFRASEVRR